MEGITIERKSQRNEIIEKYQGKGRGSRGALRAELQEQQKVTESIIEPFLTDEQMEKFRKLSEQRLKIPTQKTGRSRRNRF
jgi:hypothetical protein